VFRELLCHGRLSFRVLLHHSRLTPRQLKHSLAVLIQQHLTLWHTSEDNVTVYEANIITAYALVRSGKYVKLAEDRWGEFAGGILSNLLLLGHARIGDLARAYKFIPPKDINGVAEKNHGVRTSALSKPKAEKSLKENVPTLESLHQALCDLLQARILNVVHESHFRTETDNRTEAEKEVPRPDKWASKLKKEQQFEWDKSIERKLQDWKYGTEHSLDEMISLQKGRKRPREDTESNLSFKRQKLYNGAEIVTSESLNGPKLSQNEYLDDDIVLRVNHDKFDVMMRNQRLVELAEQCIGSTTAKVYAELLRKLESELQHCKASSTIPEEVDGETDLTSLPQVATHKLEALLKEPADFAGVIAQIDPSQIDLTMIDHRKKLRRKMAAKVDLANGVTVVGDASSDEDETEDVQKHDSEVISDDELSVSSHEFSPVSPSGPIPDPPVEAQNGGCFSILRQHLLLLCEHPYSFVHHVPRTSSIPEKWAVDFRSLSSTLQHLTLTSTLTSRFGSTATRLANILIAKGKLDEKALSAHSLLNVQPLRPLLTDLQKAGLFQLQEVPRDGSRQPSRTFFFWEWDAERARSKVLEDCYGAMARLVWRLRVEKGKVRALVEKAERSDVLGREEELLGKEEMMALRRWWGVAERVWGEVGRLDEMVAVLRDF
jgi:DNA-directed RNA polymerase III subunit RPC3